jgi:CheY-like chemotaxis protein
MLNSPLAFTPTSLAHLQVLLVEDEPDIAELLLYVLEASGATVLLATTALEALQLLDTQRPQLLVCNLRLPDLDGKELLQTIRGLPDPTVRYLPAIAVTSYHRDYSVTDALRAGFDRFLSKQCLPE